MAEFNFDRAMADSHSYNEQTKRRGESEIRDELKRLGTEVRRLEGLLDASRARDEAASELLRVEVRRTVTAEAERERWRSEAERLAAMVVPEPDGSGSDWHPFRPDCTPEPHTHDGPYSPISGTGSTAS